MQKLYRTGLDPVHVSLKYFGWPPELPQLCVLWDPRLQSPGSRFCSVLCLSSSALPHRPLSSWGRLGSPNPGRSSSARHLSLEDVHLDGSVALTPRCSFILLPDEFVVKQDNVSPKNMLFLFLQHPRDTPTRVIRSPQHAVLFWILTASGKLERMS